MTSKPSPMVYVLGTTVGASLAYLVSVPLASYIGGLLAASVFFLVVSSMYFIATNALIREWFEYATAAGIVQTAAEDDAGVESE
ncbi:MULTISPECIES: hypothetical protein [Salinibaculum]|uniref:hypothetical protein n=1 Tax=Salinibaculum TaxID=2732368 RepID=UPI0030D4A7EE